MKRELRIPRDGRIEQKPDVALKIAFGSLGPGSIALELALLKAALSDTLTIRQPESGPVVKLRVAMIEERATVAHRDSPRVELVLSVPELDRWLGFFLKYYRDSVAEVDHLDVEARDLSEAERLVDIVVSVSNAAPAVSPDEARRRLGL